MKVAVDFNDYSVRACPYMGGYVARAPAARFAAVMRAAAKCVRLTYARELAMSATALPPAAAPAPPAAAAPKSS